jgi:hypothetical protein
MSFAVVSSPKENEFYPESAHDLVDLPKYHIYLKWIYVKRERLLDTGVEQRFAQPGSFDAK